MIKLKNLKFWCKGSNAIVLDENKIAADDESEEDEEKRE